MNKWILLSFAIISEVIATSSLKSTEGFTKLWPSVIVLVGYSAAFYFLSLTLDTIPIGVAYAVWSGIGIAGIALVSVFFFEQRLDAGAIIGMALIVAGVVVYDDAFARDRCGLHGFADGCERGGQFGRFVVSGYNDGVFGWHNSSWVGLVSWAGRKVGDLWQGVRKSKRVIPYIAI